MRLKDTLKAGLTREELSFLVGSFDIVGDIAIIIVPPELRKKEDLIADAILKTHKNIKTVARRAGNYEGEFRIIDLAVIGGEELHETEHRENGVRFFLNPGKVYYSVRSSNERKRIASLIRPGEHVLVMFSGIGVFPLVLAAHSQARAIGGIEKNADAHWYAQKSLAGNRRISNVALYAGDVVDVLPRLSRIFDRVLMPLPRTSEDYLGIALPVIRPGGRLHFYDFQTMKTFSESIEKIRWACEGRQRNLLTSETVVCGHCGPQTYRICIDAQIE